MFSPSLRTQRGHGKRGTSRGNPSCRSQSDALPHGRRSQMKQMSLSRQDRRTVGSHLKRHQLLALLQDRFSANCIGTEGLGKQKARICLYWLVFYNGNGKLFVFKCIGLIISFELFFCHQRELVQGSWLCCIFITLNDTLMKTELNCLRSWNIKPNKCICKDYGLDKNCACARFVFNIEYV